MPSLTQRLRQMCICGHQGNSHAASDRGTHVQLDACTKCDCPLFRRTVSAPAGSKRNHQPHGVYVKSGFRT